MEEAKFPTSDRPDYETFKEKIKREAMAHWNAYQQQHSNNHGTLTENPTTTAPCRCSFLIEDIQVTTPAEHPEFGISFLSSAECDPLDPDCLYYSGEYYSSGEFCGIINNPACFDNWTGQPLPPSGLRDFHCEVPAYSAFPVYSSFIWIDEGCLDAGNLLDWSITFKVICQESEPNPTCGSGLGYGFVSDPITFSFPGTNNSGYYQNGTIRLIECGCLPVSTR
jgi:hypothetical protein